MRATASTSEQSQIVGHHPIRHHLDLQLPDLSAEHAAGRHARHGKQARLERPIGEGAQLHRRHFLRYKAVLSRSMVEDVSGVMRGVLTVSGKAPEVSASFSASNWRARNTSVLP